MPVAAVELGVREFKADGGIMITASHNEPSFNGFKFLDKDGAVLRPKDIDYVIKEFNKKNPINKNNKNPLKNNLKDSLNNKNLNFNEKNNSMNKNYNKNLKIINKNKDLIEKYSYFLKKIIGEFDNKVKIILDVNGGSGVILNEIIKKLDFGNIKLVNGRAGKFKRKIEPNAESLDYLKEIMEDAEFAAGFDCDADRIEILLKDGSLVDGNYILALLVDDVLSKKKGVVVTNDATSNVVRGVAEKHGCSVKEVEVGEINVVDEMLKLDSPIGGEGSNGGVIISPSLCRDGILSIFYLLKIINEKGSLQKLISELPKYYYVQKKIKFDESIDNKKIKNKIKKYYSKNIIQETGDITGGLKIIIDKNNFIWFRFSKTEANLLRVIVDSNSKVECDRLMAEGCSLVEK